MRTSVSVLLGCALAVFSLAGLAVEAPAAPTCTVNGMSAGPTPFISNLDISISPPGAIKSIRFEVLPKPSSVTRPVSVQYSGAYLRGRRYYDTATGRLTLPVFGLYQDYDNDVALRCDFAKGASQDQTVIVTTAPWSDPSGGQFLHPTVVQPRTRSTDLSYDFMMLKDFRWPISPVIVDTDGEVRWVGTAGVASIPAIFYDNGIYVSSGTGIIRMELDGTFALVDDYADQGVTWSGHHNYDRGREGFLVEVTTTEAVESTVLEVDGAGNILRTWKIHDIVRDAMIAGGDDPSQLVRPLEDWFHNNACAYDRANDLLIASGREDFVIAMDYDTGAIRWILGDPAKKWYQYDSLKKYALTLVGSTPPPIGQHAVSLTRDRQLLLFDNGEPSLNQSPAGDNRPYSAPRKYQINARKMTAEQTWSYEPKPSIDSAYCSSVYEDARQNYLMDYSLPGNVMGFDGRGSKVFDYVYYGCDTSWNAYPIHLESVTYP